MVDGSSVRLHDHAVVRELVAHELEEAGVVADAADRDGVDALDARRRGAR